jgi:hypothetical protein
MALSIEKLIPLSSRNYTGYDDRRLSGDKYGNMRWRYVPIVLKNSFLGRVEKILAS